MFERYTELARRAIFFARYEASVYGEDYISTEHLLLGVLREDKSIAAKLPVETARRHIESRIGPPVKRISSVDLPLTHESKRALAYAAEEATALHHKHIDTVHLALGLLRIETSLAAEILRNSGLDAPALRAMPPRPVLRSPLEQIIAERIAQIPQPMEETTLTDTVRRWQNLVATAAPHFMAFSEKDAEAQLARRNWSRKEALGHLIDMATAHHQWIVRALIDPKVTAPGYPDEAWVAHQKYASQPWDDLIETWSRVNALLARVAARIPEKKLETPCRIGIADPIPLAQLIRNYVEHTSDLLGEILAHL